ncbi:type II toxin-antitoxin system PemK/MazF family toxin [Pseudomonas yamanorum]|uniref:type II toxin-antitoxin system PemK/MazF family toxin n=1 Tax=Pseudomonas yamanorum TaxID=515393 RepID=UPI003F755BBD
MPLYHHPKQGDVLLCDFTRGFVAPEMLKIRKVVVISPTATHKRKLCTVVPISSTAPDIQYDWHHLLRINPLHTDGYKALWVKCDMIYTVSFERLDKLHRKTRTTGREYFVPRLGAEDMRGVIDGVKAYLPL